MLGKIISFRLFPTNLTSIITKKSYAPRRKSNARPEVDEKLKTLREIPQIAEDPEGFGDLETDFMNVHKSYNQYKKESLAHREKIKLWIIKNKYFKEKHPNFLTYAEKEQIKLLNSRYPDEWTPEKLSESFPANVETIVKVIKANWVASSKQRILRHDQTVMTNWTLYKQGKLNVNDENLKTHLDKFANRKTEDIENIQTNWKPKSLLPLASKIKEFSKIITSCKSYTNNQGTIMIENSKKEKENKYENTQGYKEKLPREDETYLIDKVIDKKYMRLKDVKEIKNLTDSTAKELELENIKETVNDSRNVQIQTENPFKIQKLDTREVEISRDDMKKYDMTPVKQRIYIPRKLWKADSLYKLEDCYYDCDGEFLYRVPGMTGKKV